MKFLAYTCVFGSYDRVFPPVRKDPALDYVIVTDDPVLLVEGWRTFVVDPAPFGGSRAANRHYKMLGHRILGDYQASIYVDGNIRMLGNASRLLADLYASRCAIGVYRHSKRNSIAEEMEACIEHGKTGPNQQELEDYLSDGFNDQQGLVEAGVLMRNHDHVGLDAAMSLWWSLFERYNSRDQFSLPYVLWKTGLPCEWQDRSFREKNPYFGIYPHIGAGSVSPNYAYLCARSYDSTAHRILLGAWHVKWQLQRKLRRFRESLASLRGATSDKQT